MVLGTSEGLTGSTELEIDETWVGVFDLVLLWLALGDASVQNSLMEENATPLLELALYFGLDALAEAIREEEQKRYETEKAKLLLEQARLEKARLAKQEQERRIQERARGIVRCYACGDRTTVAPTYRGTTPRCWSCRKSRDDDNDDEDYFCRDEYNDGGYDSDGWSYNS
jgi:hypothetical protein